MVSRPLGSPPEGFFFHVKILTLVQQSRSSEVAGVDRTIIIVGSGSVRPEFRCPLMTLYVLYRITDLTLIQPSCIMGLVLEVSHGYLQGVSTIL